MENIEKLKYIIGKMESEEFIAVFYEWLDNHDDADISCMTDAVDTLLEECTEELDRSTENM